MRTCLEGGGNRALTRQMWFMNGVSGRTAGEIIILIDLGERQLGDDQLAFNTADLFQAFALGTADLAGDRITMHK